MVARNVRVDRVTTPIQLYQTNLGHPCVFRIRDSCQSVLWLIGGAIITDVSPADGSTMLDGDQRRRTVEAAVRQSHIRELDGDGTGLHK